MTNLLKVLLADDHALFCEALALLIDAESDMKVVAQAETGAQAIRLAEQHHPDVVVLDSAMPDGDGASAAQRIRATCPDAHILALTAYSDEPRVRGMLQAGASGYVLKTSAAQVLIQAIRTVAQGRTFIEPGLAPAAQTPAASDRARGKSHLTPREEEVLRGVAWGRTAKEIAATLSISVKTVESYKTSALEKLKLRTRNDVVRYALTQGWLNQEPVPR